MTTEIEKTPRAKLFGPKRPSIYMSPPLYEIKKKARSAQSFSARLAEVSERYTLLCTQTPDLSEEELFLLVDTIDDLPADLLTIKHLADEIRDSEHGDTETAVNFSERVKAMSYAERIAMIEAIKK